MTIKSENQIIADLLHDTMTSSAIMDDYDELLGDYDNLESFDEYHNSVLVAINFINKYGTDKTEINMNYFISTYIEMRRMLIDSFA